MLLQHPPAENDTRQGFSVAGESLWRNLRGRLRAARKCEPRTR